MALVSFIENVVIQLGPIKLQLSRKKDRKMLIAGLVGAGLILVLFQSYFSLVFFGQIIYFIGVACIILAMAMGALIGQKTPKVINQRVNRSPAAMVAGGPISAGEDIIINRAEGSKKKETINQLIYWLEHLESFTSDEIVDIKRKIDDLIAINLDWLPAGFSRDWRELKHFLYHPEAKEIQHRMLNQLKKVMS